MEYKAYSFDLDDNLVSIPTVVYLKDKNENIKEFSTLEFEKIRGNMEELGLREFSDSFLNFDLDEAIFKNFTKKNFEDFRNSFTEKYKNYKDVKTDEELLDLYLDLCKFYPVNNKETKKELGNDLGTSELKAVAFEDFQKYVNLYVKEKFGDKCKIKIGFSDDSILHLKSIVNSVLKKHGLFFYQTKKEGKESFI